MLYVGFVDEFFWVIGVGCYFYLSFILLCGGFVIRYIKV